VERTPFYKRKKKILHLAISLSYIIISPRQG